MPENVNELPEPEGVPAEATKVSEVPAEPEKPKTIAVEDRLRAELLQAKMQNVQLQVQLIQSELKKALEGRNGLVLEMNNLRTEFLSKYGIDLARIQIFPDGTYGPAPTQGN